MDSYTYTGKRRRMNLTIREEVADEAKSLDLNVSHAAETGIIQAIRAARADAWRQENRVAIDHHNRRIEQDGVLLTPDWSDE